MTIYSIMVEKEGIMSSVSGEDLDDFIMGLSREDLLKAIHQLFDEVARLRVVAGETAPILHA